MEDNIYDELDNYERVAEYDELKEENTRLQQCVRDLTEKISQLTQDNLKLTERLDNIEKSFAALLNTAKAEIERKTEMIATLNMEKDQLIFRHIGNRNNPPYRRNFDRKPQNNNPNKRKLDYPPSEEKKIPRLEAQRDVRDTEVQISNRKEERVEDENRNPTAIRRNDEFKERRRQSVRNQSPNFSSDDETFNPHYNNQTPIPNSPEYIEPELIPKEDPNPTQNVQNIRSAITIDERNNSEELRRSNKDFHKYDNNFESSVKSRCLENKDLRHQIRSSDRYKSRRMPSREFDDRYGNARFDRDSRSRRFSRLKYRDETKPRYSKSRTRVGQEKFDRCRQSRSQSPGFGLGSHEGRRLSRYSREMTGYSMTRREFRKSSISPNRVRQKSVEKHWNNDREPRWKRSSERSHSNSREDHDVLSLRRQTDYVCEPAQLEDTKLECHKEEAYSQTLNPKNHTDIHKKREHVTNSLHGTYTDHKKYNNEHAHEPKLPMWEANRVLWELNKGRCRSNSFSQLDRQSSRDQSANSRVCQSPDEMDGGYTPAPIEAFVLIPGKGPLTVYDDPRLYHEKYFQNEEIGKHKANRLYNAKELDTLNLRSRRHVNWKPTRFKYEIQETTRQYHILTQETTRPHYTLSTQETISQDKFIRDLQHRLQQHQQQEQQDHKKTKLSDEEITQIYADTSGRCSQASLESGEIEDSLNFTEKVEKTDGKVEPQLSTEMKTCMDAINPGTLEPTLKKENVRHTAKLPSINDPILTFHKQSNGYKIPIINNNSKNSSKTRKYSEDKNSNISLKHNITSKLGVNNVDKFGNCELEKGMPLEHTLRTQETRRQEKFTRDLQHQLQQHQQQEQQDHKKTKLSDEDIAQIYADISGRCSQASLESGEIEDSLNFTEKVENTDGRVGPQLSTEMRTCMDAINPEKLEPTLKKENVRHTPKLPSINDPILPFKNKSKGYKIPKINNNSKDRSKTRKDSDNNNSNISLKQNMTSQLDVNNMDKFGNCELGKGDPLENAADKIKACHNEEELNTKPEDNISNLNKFTQKNMKERLENRKHLNKLEVKLQLRENSNKESRKNTEIHKNKKYDDNCKANKDKEKEIFKETSKDHSKESSKEQNKLKPISVSQQQSDEYPEQVNDHDYDEKTLKICQHSESTVLSTRKPACIDHSKNPSNDVTKSKLKVYSEDMKLSDLHNRKELQSGENPKLVNFHDDDEKTPKIGQHNESDGLYTEKASASSYHSKKFSNDMTESKMDVDSEDKKLSDFRKQKELDDGESEHLEHNMAKHSKKEHSRIRRKSKTGSIPNVKTSPPILPNDSVISPVHVFTVSKSKTTIKPKDSKQINKATDQILVSVKHIETVKTENKVESTKNNPKKEIKFERHQSIPTSKIENDLKGAQIEQHIKNKAKNERNPEKIIELFGESSLITPEDLQIATVHSAPSSDIHPEMEFELNELFDEHVKTAPSILCKIDKSKISGDLRKSEPSKTIITMAKEITQKNFTEAMLNEKLSKDNNKNKSNETKQEVTSLLLQHVENNLSGLGDIKAEEGSKNNPNQGNNYIPFEKPSVEIQAQEKITLGTKSITTEHIVKHNYNTPKSQDSTPAENFYNNLASKVNEISRDMPSIIDLIDNEKYRQSDCITSENLEKLPVVHTNILLKLSNKNSDSEPHTDSDCERPLFMTSTPNPKISPKPYQKAMCIHSPIKEITTPEISEQTNCVTGPNDSLQSISSTQVNVSESQASLAPIGAPTQVLFIRRKRRVIVREP